MASASSLSSFLCAKRPPRKPRRGQQREPTPMCSPCLSRRRSRNLKRWKLLIYIWPRMAWGLWKCMNMHDGSPCRVLCPSVFCVKNIQQHVQRSLFLPPCMSLSASPFPLFILAVCPPVYFPVPGLAAVRLVVCWYEGQWCSDIQTVSSVIRL